MTDEQIEKAARDHADKYFIQDAGIICNEPWDKAKDLYTKTLADFAKHALSHQWVSVEERLPEIGELVVAAHIGFVTATYDGEDWYDANDHLIRPTHWLPIPPLKGGDA